MNIGIKELCAAAEREIVTITVAEAYAQYACDDNVVVDIRDIRELQRDGKIPGAYHAPRGMLEFWVDPESPYHKSIFTLDKKFIFYCGGGMRSALATQTVQMMGLKNTCHVEGGFAAWRKDEYPIDSVEK